MKKLSDVQLKNEHKKRDFCEESNYNGIDDKILIQAEKVNDKANVDISNNNENGAEMDNRNTSFNSDSSESLLIATKEEYFVCEICNYRCKQKGNLQVHMALHSAEKPLISCQLCHLKFKQRASLNFHMKKRHLDEVQNKPVVDQTDNLKTHVSRKKMDRGKLPYKCDIANQKLQPLSKKPFTCQLCKEKFTQKTTLDFHIKNSHVAEDLYTFQNNLYMCRLCNFTNARKGNLKTHMRTHSGEKPFKCKLCKRQFTQLCHLQVHNRRHTGEKPFSCTICNFKFTQKSNLLVHMRTHERDSSQIKRNITC